MQLKNVGGLNGYIEVYQYAFISTANWYRFLTQELKITCTKKQLTTINKKCVSPTYD